MTQDLVLADLLARNAQWAEETEETDPGFLLKLATEKQSPKVLWIGCSDSRVPESVITASRPGDIFVHRNIANLFHPDDDSALSVLTYAVEDVGVSHVIVVGHTRCGGAQASQEAAQKPPVPPTTPLERWLAPLVELARETEGDLTALVEANVRAQVENIVDTDVIRHAWAGNKDVKVHGWIYELETGTLRDLEVTASAGKQ